MGKCAGAQWAKAQGDNDKDDDDHVDDVGDDVTRLRMSTLQRSMQKAGHSVSLIAKH